MTRRRAALLLVVALGGCRQVLGLDDRQVGPTEGTAENSADAHARAFCGEAEACCDKHGYDFKGGSCEREVAGVFQGQVAEARSAGLTFDPVAALECLRATGEVARTCEPTRK